ncbi:hypothetical protein Tco_1465402 [Tanacetum coccineum]
MFRLIESICNEVVFFRSEIVARVLLMSEGDDDVIGFLMVLVLIGDGADDFRFDFFFIFEVWVLENAPLTEQQHASGFALSHAVVERPFPSKLGSISKENNGLSVSTKPGTVEESGEIDGVLVNANQRKLLKLPMKPLTDGQTISSLCVSGSQRISLRPKNNLNTCTMGVCWVRCNEIFVYGVAHLHSGGVGTALYGERKTLTTMTSAELILDESARTKLKEKALDSDTNGQGKHSQDHEDPDDPYVRLKHDCVAIMAAFKIKEPYEHYGIVVNSHNYWRNIGYNVQLNLRKWDLKSLSALLECLLEGISVKFLEIRYASRGVELLDIYAFVLSHLRRLSSLLGNSLLSSRKKSKICNKRKKVSNNGDMYEYETLNEQSKGREVVIFEEELRYNIVRMSGKFGSKEIVSRNGQKENDNRVNGKEDVGSRRMRNGNKNAAKMGNGGGQKEAQGNKVSKTRMESRPNLNMGGGEGFDAEGDEDDCDTKEVTEEEDIGKQEVAPLVSNQVEATT